MNAEHHWVAAVLRQGPAGTKTPEFAPLSFLPKTVEIS